MAPLDYLPTLGRMLILAGGVMLLLGVVLVLAPKLPFLGRLPGDIVAGGDGVTVYLPIVSMILVSVVLTLALNLLPRLFK
jgi:hypothetical protein